MSQFSCPYTRDIVTVAAVSSGVMIARGDIKHGEYPTRPDLTVPGSFAAESIAIVGVGTALFNELICWGFPDSQIASYAPSALLLAYTGAAMYAHVYPLRTFMITVLIRMKLGLVDTSTQR